MTVQEQLTACYDFVKERISFKPKIALILGSGLGGFADKIDVKETLAYADIPNFPVSTVAGHAGRFVFGYCDGVPVAPRLRRSSRPAARAGCGDAGQSAYV